MSKIELTDTLEDSIVKIVNGNPGSTVALMELSKAVPKIDPESAFGMLSPIILFDSYEIYGSDIYIIWNDKCGKDNRKTLMLLRAVQLGFLSQSKLKEMAEDQTRQVNLSEEEWTDIDFRVCAEIKDFQKAD